MKLTAAGLLAVGLLALEGRAEPGRWRLASVNVGLEELRLAAGEAGVPDAGRGWLVGPVPAAGGGEDAEDAEDPGVSAMDSAHPVYHLAGSAPSALTRRIVTGRISVRLRFDACGPWDGGDVMDLATAAGLVALDHGLTDEGVAEGAAPWRLFRADPPDRALAMVEALRRDPRVAEADVVLARQMVRRELPNDPWLSSQWHLKNLVPAIDGGPPVDLAVETVWGGFGPGSAGWRGRGVRLGIIDDGIDDGHPEFADGRLDAAAGRNWNGGGGDGAAQGPADTHGTAVAGLVAATADNALGVAGVAPEAGLASLRLTAGPHDDAQEAQALGHLANPRTGSNPADLLHVKNASWGPADGVFRLAGPGPLARQALATAARDGRGGRGTVFVWAAGNGGALGEDANADGYANNPHVIAVGAMDSTGQVPAYSEGGACLAVVALSGSEQGLPVVTTDRPGHTGFNPPSLGTDLSDESYTSGFGGTSAAAPQVAGVCALMLQANPALGWRDVKEILLRSARRVQPDSAAWSANAVGLRFHPRQGAGLVAATAATAMAATWSPLGAPVELRATNTQAAAIPDDQAAGLIRPFTISQRRRVEHALLRLSVTHPYRGDLKITLTSPGGTTSVLAPSYFTPSPAGQAHYDQWVFSSLHFWGENAQGTWTLRVADVLEEETGRFLSAELTLLAGPLPPAPAFTSPASLTATAGDSFFHALAATHGPVAFTAVGPLPPGITFDGSTGTLRGRPSRAGTFALNVRGTNAAATTSQALTLTVLGPYESWAMFQKLPESEAGPEADPDEDGWPNVLEYAAGGRPLVADAPDVGRCSDGSDPSPVFVFTRWPARSDVTWQVDHSTNCASWKCIAEAVRGAPAESLVAPRFTVSEIPQPDGRVRVVVTDTAHPTPAHGWFRLRVAMDP
jgi:subtilisin family serine protease/subtilisin-like proprotein convertase family protein